jgi:hypothetical protein
LPRFLAVVLLENTKRPKRRSAKAVLVEIMNDPAAAATARVAAARALLGLARKSKPADRPGIRSPGARWKLTRAISSG